MEKFNKNESNIWLGSTSTNKPLFSNAYLEAYERFNDLERHELIIALNKYALENNHIGSNGTEYFTEYIAEQRDAHQKIIRERHPNYPMIFDFSTEKELDRIRTWVDFNSHRIEEMLKWFESERRS